MSKGLAQRRRLKRALDAARGNLHKIANGKALPKSLPEAPKPKDAEQLPASLRKMLALKKVATAQGKKPRAPGQDNGQSGKPGRSAARRQQQQGQDDGEGPSTSGRQGTEDAAKQQQQQQHGKDKGAGVTIKGANAFTEQLEEKKLKARKKEYLKRKAEKKRSKGGAGEVVVEKELQLRDKVKFGEVVHAPLKVHLKRKHWAEKEKTEGERCKEVFLKQMQQAQQRMQGQATDEGLAVKSSGKKGGAAGAGAAAAAAKGKKRKAPTDQETEDLRQQVVDAYRAAKKGGNFHSATVGNATLSSLATLVGKSSGAKAAAATHTLA